MEDGSSKRKRAVSSLEVDISGRRTLYKLGPAETWDIVLAIPSWEEEGGGGLKIWAHREVLSRALYFRSQFKAEWNGSIAREYTVSLEPTRDERAFVEMLGLLYWPDLSPHFTSVKKALSLLDAAAAIMFEDYISACKRYLECCPWTPKDLFAIRDKYASLSLPLSQDMEARCDLSGGNWEQSVGVSLQWMVDHWTQVNVAPFQKKRKATPTFREILDMCLSQQEAVDNNKDDEGSPYEFRFGTPAGSGPPQFVNSRLRLFYSRLEAVSGPNCTGPIELALGDLRNLSKALDILVKGRHAISLISVLNALAGSSTLAASYLERVNAMVEDCQADKEVRRCIEKALRAWAECGVHLPLQSRIQLCRLWFPIITKLEMFYRKDVRFSREMSRRLPSLLASLPLDVQAQCCQEALTDWLFMEDIADGTDRTQGEAPPLYVCLALQSLLEVGHLKSQGAA